MIAEHTGVSCDILKQNASSTQHTQAMLWDAMAIHSDGSVAIRGIKDN